MKNDKYKKARGGYSRLLNILCANCSKSVCFYQKDGPGILKRMYLDRISKSNKYQGLENLPFKNIPQFICPHCKTIIGIPDIYEKEKRLIFRLFAGAIIKSK